jgi:hypothetical protein
MATYNEPVRPLEFLVSEDNGAGQRSREKVTLLANQPALLPGTVMAKITASGKYVAYDDDQNGTTAGVGIAAGILCYPADASTSDQEVTIIARDAVVQDALLVWEASNDAGEITAGKAELLALGIVIRNA